MWLYRMLVHHLGRHKAPRSKHPTALSVAAHNKTPDLQLHEADLLDHPPSVRLMVRCLPRQNLKSNLGPRALAGSPLRQSYFPQETEQTSRIRSASNEPAASYVEDLLKTQLQLGAEKASEEGSQSLSLLSRRLAAERSASTDTSSIVIVDDTDSGAMTPNPTESSSTIQRSYASLSHILTNAIILQEFILEVAAVIQVRGTMFGEVDLKQ